MLKFKQFLIEESSVEKTQLGHLSHLADVGHEDPKFLDWSIDTLEKFHKHRMGQHQKGFDATLKHDGGASVLMGIDERGPYVTDKHRASRKAGGVIARTPEEVDQHFGHIPEYAGGMKRLLAHVSDVVKPGHRVQGDLLFTSPTKEYTPNRITYKTKSSAPIGIAIHTQETNGISHQVSNEALKKSPNVFVPEHDYSKPDPSTYKQADRTATEFHIKEARKLAAEHTNTHLTPEHMNPSHLSRYLNDTMGADQTPSIEGYQKHLASVSEKEQQKRSSQAGKRAVKNKYDALIQHVADNKQHFQRTFDIRHHLTQATEHVLKGVEHPDLQTYIDGKRSQGEGVVLSQQNRAVAKLVPWKTRRALRNNPRFGRANA